jgi:hypothetical protein
MRDLKGAVTMIVWPKALPGSADLTPSPVMDALSRTTTELAAAQSQISADALIKDDKQSKKKQKSRAGVYSTEASLQSSLTIFIRILISSHIEYCR